MAELVCNFFSSLDGVVEAPHTWHFPYVDQAVADAATLPMTEMGTALLLGRVTYEEFVSVWPGQGDSNPFAAWVNRVDKYVASTTLDEPAWFGTSILAEDLAGQVAELKAASAGTIMVVGSATTARFLVAAGLVDRVNLMVHPLVLGRGARWFDHGLAADLELLSVASFKTGVVTLDYRVLGTAAGGPAAT